MQTEILERGTKKDFSRMFDPKNGTHFEKIFFPESNILRTERCWKTKKILFEKIIIVFTRIFKNCIIIRQKITVFDGVRGTESRVGRIKSTLIAAMRYKNPGFFSQHNPMRAGFLPKMPIFCYLIIIRVSNWCWFEHFKWLLS